MADLLPVADYVERILATVSPLPAFPQPLMEALGLALAEDVVAPISLPSFDNSAMDGYAVVADDVAGASEDAPVTLPVVGEIGAGQSSILALSPGTAVKIMTGAPGAGRCRRRSSPTSGPTAASPPCGSTAPPPRASTSARPATTSPRATCCSRRAPSSGPPPRHARRRRPRHRPHPPPPARRGHLHRLRAPRPRHPAGPRLDLRRQLLPPGRRRPRGRRDRLPRRHRPRRVARLHRGAERPARPRRPRGHQRRRQRGRLRRRQGVAVPPRLDVVRRRRHAARQAAGLRHRSARTTPRSSRCPATRSPPTSPSRCSCCPRSAG